MIREFTKGSLQIEVYKNEGCILLALFGCKKIISSMKAKPLGHYLPDSSTNETIQLLKTERPKLLRKLSGLLKTSPTMEVEVSCVSSSGSSCYDQDEIEKPPNVQAIQILIDESLSVYSSSAASYYTEYDSLEELHQQLKLAYGEEDELTESANEAKANRPFHVILSVLRQDQFPILKPYEGKIFSLAKTRVIKPFIDPDAHDKTRYEQFLERLPDFRELSRDHMIVNQEMYKLMLVKALAELFDLYREQL